MTTFSRFIGLLGFMLLFCFASVHAEEDDCYSIWVETEDLTIAENSTEYIDFTVYNTWEKDFDISQVNVSKESGFSNLSLSVTNYPNRVDSYNEETVTIRVDTDSFSQDETIETKIEITGSFVGGDYCGFEDIGETLFYVFVEEESDGEENGEECADIEVVAGNVTMDEDDIVYETFSIENNSNSRFYVDGFEVSESSSYIEAEIDDYNSSVAANDNGDFTIRIESESVSSDKTATVGVKVRGHFSGEESCSYNETGEDSFTVTVEDAGGDGFVGGSGCSSIEFSVNDITVGKGKTETKNFVIENSYRERFYIDLVEIYDESGEIKAESNGYDKTVYSNGIGTVGVKVQAYDDAETGKERAYIKVEGHFRNGATCRMEDNEEMFYVNVVEEEEDDYVPPALPRYSDYCSGFFLTVPTQKTVQGSGTINLRIENNTAYRATVRFYGNGLDVDPSVLSIPSGFNSESYGISVFPSNASSTLYYEVETFNCLTRQSTRIVLGAEEQEQEQQEEAEEQEPESEQEELQTIGGTMFAVLESTAVSLGLLVIVVLLVIYIIVSRK